MKNILNLVKDTFKLKILSIITLFILLSCTNERINKPSHMFLTKEINKNIIINDSIKIDEIVNIKNIPYINNCNDSIFWSLVKQKGNIPELIKKLSDETVLKGVFVPNFGGEYTIADVSLLILNEKIKGIPVFKLIDKQLSKECGYCSYWNFVRENNKNRQLLYNNLNKWYNENKNRLIWVNYNYSLTGDCISPVKGHYEISK